ncbi:MAG TPA: HU family DNA-binding protein [Planctomycetota bacterium]|nr:HU family DNA-binding protein [Planctomycetota bacterium]
MNRAQLAEVVAKAMGDCSKAAADRAVGAVLSGISRGLRRDGRVRLEGFGTFLVKRRRAREGRNPRNGQPIRIPASRTVGFKPGQGLKAKV